MLGEHAQSKTKSTKLNDNKIKLYKFMLIQWKFKIFK